MEMMAEMVSAVITTCKRDKTTVPFYARNGQFRKEISTWLEAVRLCPFEMKVNIKYLGKIFQGYGFFLKNSLKLAVDKVKANVRLGGYTLSKLSSLYAVKEGGRAYAC